MLKIAKLTENFMGKLMHTYFTHAEFRGAITVKLAARQ